MPASSGGAARPRYQRLADELMERIGAGTYAVGGYLPTEMELCREYGISRHTVREAMRRLRDAGLVEPRRRVGTEVVARTPNPGYRQPTNSIRDLLQYAEETRLTMLQTRWVTAGPSLVKLLECGQGDRWLRVTSLRTALGAPRPVCWTTAYLDPELPDIEHNLARLSGPISAMLERVYGLRIARVEQSIQAVCLSKREARLLQAEAGDPALRAVRRYYDERGSLIQLSSAIHPGDRFTYVTSLVRN